MDGELKISTSPWRRIFEEVRHALDNRRDEHGVVGSINWLRKQMAIREANPNVVRNIIYRDKGRLADKRVLYTILNELWENTGRPPLQAPELAELHEEGGAEEEALRLLSPEKRRAYHAFVSAVRGDQHPKLLVVGRPGSGKTLLSDYVQQALTLLGRTPIRLELGGSDLGVSLGRLARKLGVPAELFEAKLIKIGLASAFAVQADAQAEVARVILEAVRAQEARVLLLHISQTAVALEPDMLGMAPLRLNTPEVPRVSAAEWLWLMLLEPLSRLPGLSLLVTMAELSQRAAQQPGRFEEPIKLSPPSTSEAKRFVRARLPHLPLPQQEAIVQRAGRSYEDLRTLTLLAETREATPSEDGLEAHLAQLSSLVETAGDKRLRNFLAVLAVMSLPEFPTLDGAILARLRPAPWREISPLERAFLDAVPGEHDSWRCFSRQLARMLRQRLSASDPALYQELHRQAAAAYQEAAPSLRSGQALAEPHSEAAARYLHHLFEARDWGGLERWLKERSIQQSLLQRLWRAATTELPTAALEGLALQVASYYVKLGSFDHPDALQALTLLANATDPAVRTWTQLKRAEEAVLKGRFEQAEELLSAAPPSDDPLLKAEIALLNANIARWRSQLTQAAEFIQQGARLLPQVRTDSAAKRLAEAKLAVWAGLIAKDRGDLEAALCEFDRVAPPDDLIRARLAFQKGDVLLQLGRFDQALSELNLAVALSSESEAPRHEQARYLARRAALHRRRAEFARAAEEFGAALAALEPMAHLSPLEHAFERAKVMDEQALYHLAVGRFDEAIGALQHNLDTFERYQTEHQISATFRLLRSRLRLALAYWCRGAGQPYHPPLLRVLEPLPDTPDIRHAQTLLAQIQARLQPSDPCLLPLGAPLWKITSLLAATPEAAVLSAQKGLALARYPYQIATAQTILATALLRGGRRYEAGQALSAAKAALTVTEQPGEQSDSGLLAWLSALELRLALAGGQFKAAVSTLLASLEPGPLAPYHEALLRVFGEAVELLPNSERLSNEQRLAQLLPLPTSPGSLRLPDELVLRWRQQRRPPAK